MASIRISLLGDLLFWVRGGELGGTRLVSPEGIARMQQRSTLAYAGCRLRRPRMPCSACVARRTARCISSEISSPKIT